MLTTATPLPALARAAATGGVSPHVLPALPVRPSPATPLRRGVLARPVLHTRVPQQLCLDLQPRGR